MPKANPHSEELLSVDEYEKAARRKLSEENVNYIFKGAETESTLHRNIEAFSKYLLRRRVLQGIDEVRTNATYFDGRIRSDLPYFPGCINVGPLHRNALLDILNGSAEFHTAIFISHFSIVEPLEISKLPHLVPKTTPLIWQIYLEKHNYELCFKQAKLAKSWGYAGLTIT
ncbi:MAG: alpha-hydroxy-acid oxidizing protein, partial [Thaumarchaeota archaeon]|nr:alpha-hydroxy-acid oxidizing protein [Nitrososphaerota archaeon]